MRPEKARRVVQNAIQFFLKTKGDATKLYEAEKALTILEKTLRKEYLEGGWGYDEHQYPSIKKDYGKRYNKEEMFYISDRFMAPHRLDWLLVGVRGKLFGKYKQRD